MNVEWWFWPLAYMQIGIQFWLLSWISDYQSMSTMHDEIDMPEWASLLIAATLWPLVAVDILWDCITGARP